MELQSEISTDSIFFSLVLFVLYSALLGSWCWKMMWIYIYCLCILKAFDMANGVLKFCKLSMFVQRWMWNSAQLLTIGI